MKPGRGRLFVVSAPSGAGKTTLVRRIVAERPDLTFSISYTTRPQRAGETDGRDYHFLSRAEFERLRDGGAFLEHAEVFGNLYGTGREQVSKLRDASHDVLLEIDWQGAQQVRHNEPDCCSIFILPPSISELERRLRDRNTDSDAVIARRLSEAVGDIGHWIEFDHVVVNDNIDASTATLLAVLNGQSPQTSTADPVVRERIAARLAH